MRLASHVLPTLVGVARPITHPKVAACLHLCLDATDWRNSSSLAVGGERGFAKAWHLGVSRRRLAVAGDPADRCRRGVDSCTG